jgi:hypothetical protein
MGFWDGNSDESLFHAPLIDYFREHDLNDFNAKTADIKDERLHAIVSALVVETLIDRFLALLMPKYDELVENGDVTFSIKTKVISAFKIIPNSIIACANCVRSIRNEFAHNLEKTSFYDISEKSKRKLFGIHTNIFKKENSNLFENFKSIMFYFTTGIDAYMTNLSVLTNKIRSKTFIDELNKEFIDKNEIILKKIIDLKPNTILVIDDKIIHSKDNGVFEIYKNINSKSQSI